MSEKKQDQLIRETFDQYRTGIGSMPSQRAQIIYRMGEKPAANTRLYYRIAAVAAALVLLLGVAVPVLSGNGLLTGHPDQVRTTGDLAAVRPEPTGFVPLAQPEGTPETSAQPEPEDSGSTFRQEVSLNYHTWLDSMNRDLVDALVPVDYSYEKSGIRLNVLQGAVTETEALLVYSVEDLIGGRFNESTYFPVYPDIGAFDSFDTFLAEMDEDNKRYTFGIHVRYQDLAHCLDGSSFPLEMPYLDVIKSKTVEFTANRESSESPTLVDLPELMDYYVKNHNGGQNEYYTTDDYRNLGLKVIDYSRPRNYALGKHVKISYAGIYGNQLHVQLHFLDNAPVQVSENMDVDPLMDVSVSLMDGTDLHSATGMAGSMRWDTNGDGIADFEELVFSLDSIPAGALKFRVDLTESTLVLKGGWKVDVPLALIWTGEASYSEISRRIEKENIPDYVKENYPQFDDCLVPVNLSCEDQGIRMDIIYGAVREQEALFVYSVEELEGACIMESVSACPVLDSDLQVRATYAQLAYDNPVGRYTGVVHYRYDNLSDISQNGEIGLGIHGMQNVQSETWHLEDLLREYVGYDYLVDLPVLLEYKVKNNFDGKIEYYTNEDYQKLGLKVLDGEDVDHLSGDIHVNGIGTAEGMIHLQLAYLRESDEYASRTVNVSCYDRGTDADLPAWAQPLAWDINNDGIADYEEYIFPYDPEALDNLRLEVTVTESDPAIEGDWKVRIPLNRFPFLDTESL
ncbi:MAG: hypothetical protein IJL36_07710 [Clostridia bacterium]|nr:hypothetical protein [Clostridia bacterium]